MVSYEALVQQLHSSSSSEQHRAVAALSRLPLTSHNWLSAVGAIPRLVQLLNATSTALPQARAIRSLLRQISTYTEAYIGGSGSAATAPDGVIPPLVSLLQHHNDAYVRNVAVLTLSTLAVDTGNQHKIMEAGAIAPLVQMLKTEVRLRGHTIVRGACAVHPCVPE